MVKNLQTADTIVKLVLAVTTIIFYFANVISGPMAQILLILAIAVITIFAAKAIITIMLID